MEKTQQTPFKGTQKKEQDYLEKFKASSKEAMALKAERDALQNKLNSVSSVTVDEDELKAEYPDWDNMPSYAQKTIKDNKLLEKKLNKFTLDSHDFMQKNAQERQYEKLLQQDKRLAEKEDEFKLYIKKHQGADLEVLAKAFVADIPNDDEEDGDIEGLETGSGFRPAPKENKIDTSRFRVRSTPQAWIESLKRNSKE